MSHKNELQSVVLIIRGGGVQNPGMHRPRLSIRGFGLATGMCAALIAPAGQGAEIALDVGHSLARPGAISARGRGEFEFNRDLAAEIAPRLRAAGFTVRPVGADGSMNTLGARVQAARGADFVLSVHHDSTHEHFLQPWVHDNVERRHAPARFAGFSIFVSRKNPQAEASLACASAIGAAMIAAGFTPSLYHAEPIPGESKPFADRANGVHWYDKLAVLRGATVPAVLFEAGVILNCDEELALSDPARRARMAEAVTAGVRRCMERASPERKAPR